MRDTERTIDAFAELQEVWVRALGVPSFARTEKIMKNLAYLIDDPVEVDAISLIREVVRVKVLCRDPTKINGTSEVFLNKIGYKITWVPEGIKQSSSKPDEPKDGSWKDNRRRREEEDSRDSHTSEGDDKKDNDRIENKTQGSQETKNKKQAVAPTEDDRLSEGEGERVDIP